MSIELDAEQPAAARLLVVETAGHQWRRAISAHRPLRLHFGVFLESATERLPVRLEDAHGVVLSRGEIGVVSVGSAVELWGVVESPGRPLAMRPGPPDGDDLARVEIARLHPDELPSDWRALGSLDRLMLSVGVLGNSGPGRIRALRRWLWQGGTLDLAGSGDRRTGELEASLATGCWPEGANLRCGAGRLIRGIEPQGERRGADYRVSGSATRLERVTRTWLATASLPAPEGRSTVGAEQAVVAFAALWAAVLCLLSWPGREGRRARTRGRGLPLIGSVAAGCVAAYYLGLVPQGREVGFAELRVTHLLPGADEALVLSTARWTTPAPGRVEVASDLGAALVDESSSDAEQVLGVAGEATLATSEMAQWGEMRTSAAGFVSVEWREAGLRAVVRRGSGAVVACSPLDAPTATTADATTLRALLEVNGFAVRALCAVPAAEPSWQAPRSRARGRVTELLVLHERGS